jgi:hypothetical protein
MPCSTVPSLVSKTTISSDYFTMPIIFFLFWSLQHCKSFVGQALFPLLEQNRRQRASLSPPPPPPNFTHLVTPWSSSTSALWSMYNLLLKLPSRQSIPVFFRICIHVVHFTPSNAFCQSIQQAHNSSSISNVRPDITLSTPTASVLPPISFSTLLISILDVVFIARVTQNFSSKNWKA